jgi:hypothetical protein
MGAPGGRRTSDHAHRVVDDTIYIICFHFFFNTKREKKKNFKVSPILYAPPKKKHHWIFGQEISFRCANGFHTSEEPSLAAVPLLAAGILYFPFPLSFFPSPPFLLPPCTARPSIPSASSAAALCNPRSAKPNNRRAALATRYRVRTRAGAGVRLGKLRAGEGDEAFVLFFCLCLGRDDDNDREVVEEPATGRRRESEVALLVLVLVLVRGPLVV